MATRIQLRRDTAANWADANPTLAVGEAGFDVTNNQLRIGDGERNWIGLTPLDGSNINLSIYATKSALNTETATRAAADLQHSEDIEGLQMQIDAIAPDDDSALTARVTTLEGEMDTVQGQIQGGSGLISDLDGRVTELEENGGGGGLEDAPSDGKQYGRQDGSWTEISSDNTGGGGGGGLPGAVALTYKGTSYWPSDLADGDAYAHPDDSTLFLPNIDLNGFELGAFLDEFVRAGTTFLITETADKNRWVHMEATGNPSFQRWGRNIPTNRIGGNKEIRAGRPVELMIDLAHAASVRFDPGTDLIRSGTTEARVEQIEEAIAAMRRDLTALKGQLTKLKKANG